MLTRRLKFDTRNLTMVCDILQNATANDEYGHTTAYAGAVVATNVPCQLTQGRGAGKETKAEKQINIIDYFLYMMPITNVSINEHMWIRINGTPTQLFDILDVNQPLIPGAPIEMRIERVKP